MPQSTASAYLVVTPDSNGPLTLDTLTVRFASREALQREFDRNIANRGLFVVTEGNFEVRQPVLVDIVLDYVDPSAVALELEGEVVHVVPKELAANGAEPGVAVQLDATAHALRARFEALLGQGATTDPDFDGEAEGRRNSRRRTVRVPVRVMPTMRPPFEATSRDLSASGILLSMKQDALPIGEIVRVCLWHPSGEPCVELDGKVVRHVPNKKGRIAAVAVAFDRSQAADPRTRSVIDALREAGHRSQLGGISGSISDLGLANMLQMFGGSAPRGTLVVEHHGEQGWIAFAEGNLLAAEVGGLSGHDALVTMLGWGDGRFQFEATADEKLVETAEPCPLAGAVFEAVCAIDEAERETPDPGETYSAMLPLVGPTTTFEVDVDLADRHASALDKTEQAVVELALTGFSVARACEVIPEPSAVVHAAFESLVALGVLVPR